MLGFDGSGEPYWVLFRLLYGGQFVDPGLFIFCDYFFRCVVVEGMVEAFMVEPVHPVHGANSTSTNDAQDCVWISSVLYKPLTVSARALS